MAIIIFILFTGLMIIVQARRERNYINLISLLMGPYFIIVPLNNLLFSRYGFYTISDEVLWMLLSTFVAFFIGSIFVTPNKAPVIYEVDNEKRFDKYNINAMANLEIIIGIIGLIKLLFLVRSGGFSGSMFSESEGVMGNGIVGHLLLVSYSVLPIIFLYWVEHKENVRCLIATILIIGVTFTTFVKYNVIGVVVSIFIFTTIYKKSILRRALIIMLSIVAIIFVANYFIGFYVRGTSAQSSFYLNHLWGYTAGSTIYDNNLFIEGFDNKLLIEKMMIFIMAFPNMFITKLFGGEGIFIHTGKPFRLISIFGENSNVTDAIGYLFPANGDIMEKIFFYMLIMILGFIFSRSYMRSKAKADYFNTYMCNMLTYFIFFSFFGTFYVFAGPWEILIYSLIVPSLFLKGTNLRKGIIRLS